MAVCRPIRLLVKPLMSAFQLFVFPTLAFRLTGDCQFCGVRYAYAAGPARFFAYKPANVYLFDTFCAAQALGTGSLNSRLVFRSPPLEAACVEDALNSERGDVLALRMRGDREAITVGD